MGKRFITLALVLAIMILPGIALSQVSFLEVTSLEEMEAARRKSADQDLPMFVDVYATWCGPCKIMDRDVYTDPVVAAYMNAHFINIRMDGEVDYGRQFAADNNLEGYPSMFIFSPSGDYISRVVGFTPANDLVEELKGTADNYSIVSKFRGKHESGALKGEELLSYINAIRLMGNDEEAEKLALDYMDQIKGKKLSDEDIGVLAYYLTLDASWWPAFSRDPDKLVEVLGDDYVLSVENIFNRTLLKAIEEENIALISALSNEIPPLVEKGGTDASGLRTLPFLQYYYYTGKHDELIKYVDDRYAVEKKDDHEWLYTTASQIIDMDQQYGTQVLLENGVEWFQACIDLDKQFDYYFYHGMVLYMLKQPDEARISFNEAEKLAEDKEQKELINQVMSFVDSQ